MASSFHRLVHRALPSVSSAVALAGFAVSWNEIQQNDARTLTPKSVLCDAPARQKDAVNYQPKDPAEPIVDPSVVRSSGMNADKQDDGLYHNLFPRRQLWKPNLEYPLWDYNWDGRQPPPIVQSECEEEKSELAEARRERYIRKNGVTRHIILIRHGQYEETHKEDEKRLLTPLGRKQAELTGKRLGDMIRGANAQFGPCRVKVVHVSDLARAKESADIIYKNMDLDNFDGFTIDKSEPDPLLNEGRPCHNIPGGNVKQSTIDKTDEQHARIEKAFRKYFYRAQPPDLRDKKDGAAASDEPKNEYGAGADLDSSNPQGSDGKTLKPHPQHEFEVVVCHGNVIRYFFCRALQLPPEAWLRLCTFNCSLTYFTVRPTGTVSCRLLGDIGHLPYDMNTFSMHPGYNW